MSGVTDGGAAVPSASEVVVDAGAFDVALPVAVVFARIPFDGPSRPAPDPDVDAAAVFFDAF